MTLSGWNVILLAALVLYTGSGSAQQNSRVKKLDYPAAPTSNQVDDYHGTKEADPYRPLEDPDSVEPRAWVAAENKLTFGYLEQIPARERIRARMQELLNYERFSVPEKKGKRAVKEPTHQEVAGKDIQVGSYYLETKNWRAALSRFESAMVLDPENPDVYWGLAEAERHLGDFAAAKTHYEKVLDYDPDGRHGKEARKVLKEPAIANAKSASPDHSAASEPPK